MTAPPDAPARPKPVEFLFQVLRLCRVQQWAKNVFVLLPLLFSESLTDPAALLAAATAFGCFCLWSSGVYCFNDVLDAAADRQHPRKRHRPIPSGRIHPAFAVALAVVLWAGAGGLAGATLPPAFLLAGGLYLTNSLLYCLVLKYRVIVDVLSIAVGFVVRLQAGCLVIGVQPTSWITVCGFALAMMLGFGKRRLEIENLSRPAGYRPTLQSYSVPKLNLLLGISASICLLSYMLYTVSPQTVARHGTDDLVYTVPVVAYGIFRYILKVQEGQHDGPVEVLLKDPVFALSGVLWLVMVVVILYLLKPLGISLP